MKTLAEITDYINSQYTPENWAYCKYGSDLDAWQEVIQLIDPDVARCILELIKKHHIKTGDVIHKEYVVDAVYSAVEPHVEEIHVFWRPEYVYREFAACGYDVKRTAKKLNIQAVKSTEKFLSAIEKAMPIENLDEWKSYSKKSQKRMTEIFDGDVYSAVRWFTEESEE